ncbi:hypothetical protein RBSWK_03142 [Rhodopirellula baltica SWK14]|uniref:Uncharacterized protein n=1 Tax=Rhodopirellula baltica SWK14 TaxID=993516 RepID=L7CHC1_RHOBT|nr:hypothetical protein RBSWK_03142 [Rhodopirellula baltica SWK14]
MLAIHGDASKPFLRIRQKFASTKHIVFKFAIENSDKAIVIRPQSQMPTCLVNDNARFENMVVLYVRTARRER